MNAHLKFLKDELCTGRNEAIDELLQHCFPEIFANLICGMDEDKVNALVLIKRKIYERLDEICQSDEPIELFLKSLFNKELVGIRKKHLSLDESFMSPFHLENTHDVAPKKEIPIPVKYFLSAFSPEQRILYEVKYTHGLQRKKGVFLIATFFLNAAAFGNDEIKKFLAEKPILHEPAIYNFFLNKMKNTYLANMNKYEIGTFHGLMQNINMRNQSNIKEIKKAWHQTNMWIFRRHKDFIKKIEKLEKFPFLQQVLLSLQYFLKITDPIQIWQYLNYEAQSNETLKSELKKIKLPFHRINKNNLSLCRDNIIKKYELNKKEIIKIETNIINISKNNIQ